MESIKKIYFNLANQTKILHLYLIPIFLGFSLLFLNPYNYQILNFGPADWGRFTGELIASIFLSLLITFFYTLLVTFLNYILGGISNIRMTFKVISFSLIPLLVGIVIIIILKIIFSFLWADYAVLIKYLFIISQMTTIIFLIIGNSVINKFSYFKSTLASSIILIIFVVFEIKSVLGL